MRGPSSSHTAAAHRIGSVIRQLADSGFMRVTVSFDRSGSLPTTYLGQGSAMGLAGGLLGIEVTDPEIISYEKHLENSNFTIEYKNTDLECKHPNAYQINIEYPEGEDFQALAVSTGGGMFEIIELNGFKVSIRGDFFENLFVYKEIAENEQNVIEQLIEESHQTAFVLENLRELKVYSSLHCNKVPLWTTSFVYNLV